MNKYPVSFALAALLYLLCVSDAFSVSDAARRYLLRGEAAMEMAESPKDYENAIKEFKNATRIAPNWDLAWFNLGFTQEKAGHYKQAITSFRKYLQLSPNAEDAGAVKNKIIKLEYKVERENTFDKEDIISMLTEINQSSYWVCNGQCARVNPGRFGYSAAGYFVFFIRAMLVDKMYEYDNINVKIEGKHLQWKIINQYDSHAIINVMECDVISRKKISCTGKDADNRTRTGFLNNYSWTWERRT